MRTTGIEHNVFAVMPRKLLSPDPTGGSRPFREVFVEPGPPLDKAEASFNRAFAAVKDKISAELDIDIDMPKRGSVVFYARHIASGRYDETSFADAFERIVRRNIYAAQHSYIPTDELRWAAETAGQTAKSFLQSKGISFDPPDVAYHGGSYFQEGRLGKYIDYLGFIVANDEEKDTLKFAATVLHENIHAASQGFVETALDEGMTELLTMGCMTAFIKAIMSKYPGTYKIPVMYQYEVGAMTALIKFAGQDNVLRGFFKGEDDGIIDAIGMDKWSKINKLAYSFSDLPMGQIFLGQFLEMLG